jgi:hypothetical protein
MIIPILQSDPISPKEGEIYILKLQESLEMPLKSREISVHTKANPIIVNICNDNDGKPSETNSLYSCIFSPVPSTPDTKFNMLIEFPEPRSLLANVKYHIVLSIIPTTGDSYYSTTGTTKPFTSLGAKVCNNDTWSINYNYLTALDLYKV